MIFQALEAYETERVYRLSLEHRAIANLGVSFASSKGVKNAKTLWYNDFEYILLKQRALKRFSPEVADAFAHLRLLGKIPDWVKEQVDLDLIGAAKNPSQD